MTAAEWKTEIGKAFAAREKLRRVHNEHSGLPPDEFRRYRYGEFLPASSRIETRINEVRAQLPNIVAKEARGIVRDGIVELPADASWAERVSLLEAAALTLPWASDDAQAVSAKRSIERKQPDQADLDSADIAVSRVPRQEPPDPLEDYTTYTETDPNNRYAVVANTITVTGLTNNEDAWIYDDKGAGHFGAAFDHDLDFKSTAESGAASFVMPWAVSNVIDDQDFWFDNNSEAVGVFSYGATPNLYVRDYSDNSSDNGAIATGTQYYLSCIRSAAGATISCYIYDDAARTSLVDTISTAMPGATTFRYVFAVNSNNPGGGSATVSAVIANLDLQEAAGISIPVVMHHLTKNIKAG